jgi:predicted peptidase
MVETGSRAEGTAAAGFCGRQRPVRNSAGYPHLLYLPPDYEAASSWPLLLFLHGVGERGRDLDRLEAHGVPRVLARGDRLPFVTVSPQCPSGSYWSSELLAALLGEVSAEVRVDPDRVYGTGLSMGGYGLWALALDRPFLFAAIAPVCGGGDPRRAGLLRRVPVWAFHGARDPVVPVGASRRMVEALQRCGGEARLTVYPDAGHDAWTETYDNPELYEWFLTHTRRHGSRETG